MYTDVLKDNTWNILVLLQECVWDPYFGYKEKVETLKRKMDELICRKQDIMDEIENAEHHSSKPRKTVVINWLSKVERLVQEFERFEQKMQITCRYSPSRICLSRRADKLQREMEDLQEQSAFPEGYFLEVNKKKLPLVTTNLKGQLFEKNRMEVLLSLNDVSSIGIYGMGGVGKTTLAMHIHDHLLKDPRFSVLQAKFDEMEKRLAEQEKEREEIEKRLVEQDLERQADREKMAKLESLVSTYIMGRENKNNSR